MDSLRKKSVTAGAALGAVFLLVLTVQFLFSGALEKKEIEIRRKQAALYQLKKNLAQKEIYETEWKETQNLFEQDQGDENAMNLWVKNLLAYSSSEGLVFNKLEPQGLRRNGRSEELRLYLSFQGDIRKLSGFLYFLLEQDPLSRVDSFVLKRDNAPGRFVYELVLGKGLS